ncbi:proline rich transmembrane protein 1B-like [Lytechinus variegatus]|uniref:proline rich transmembrane protein 1B-like n=1 Tax=Lytechinus variegatus TaxID=7654 RepID=UPI001BB2A4A5|nr:proline rich transmembrane protein 1B-like [Lytechinus variegatus]
MSSEYERFNNEDVEGGKQAVPPSYGTIGEAPSAPAYPVQQSPPQNTGQQPATLITLGKIPQVSGQQTMVHVAAGPIPKDYFGFALFVTICCCLPFGVVGLVKSSEVKSRAAVGDYTGATISSSEARRWSWTGCITGVIMWVIGLVMTCVYIGLVAACNAGNC